MDRAKAFLDATREEPDDDAHGLIYADWLEERGDPRGAFIRAQVRLARMDADDPARLDLEDEVQDLLAEDGEEWAAPLPGLVREWEFRRGFVECIPLLSAAFRTHADRLFDALPLRELHPFIPERDMAQDMAVLARCPQLAQLEALDFGKCTLYPPGSFVPGLVARGAYLRDQDFQVLLESPYLTRLTTLNFPRHGIAGPAIQALVDSPVLSRLTRLDLTGCHALGDTAARLLASARRAHSLQVLRLQGTSIGPDGLRALVHSTCFPRLHTLGIDVRRPLSRRTRNTAAALPDLLAGPLLAQLTTLEIGHSPVTGHIRLGDEGACRLAGSPHLSRLTALDLNSKGISAAGLEALAASPQLAGVTRLNLSGNTLRDTGARALADSAHLKRLTRLTLSHTGIGGAGIQALAASPNLGRLRWLDLSGNLVGPAGAQALAGSPHLRRLNHLDLSTTGLTAADGRALAQSPNLARLETLLLRDNSLGDEGVQALAASPHLARLVELHLDSNGLGHAGVEALMLPAPGALEAAGAAQHHDLPHGTGAPAGPLPGRGQVLRRLGPTDDRGPGGPAGPRGGGAPPGPDPLLAALHLPRRLPARGRGAAPRRGRRRRPHPGRGAGPGPVRRTWFGSGLLIRPYAEPL
jgi:uncharacterized protein (TIGR02996 family)